jgi:hypothetical protein
VADTNGNVPLHEIALAKVLQRNALHAIVLFQYECFEIAHFDPCGKTRAVFGGTSLFQ